jgi:DNA-binding response OmpR family regulator
MNTVLLVEDDPDFAVLLRRAFSKAGVAASLVVVTDGEEAISHLETHPSTPPALVLLDLKLPKISGFDVLRWIRSNRTLAGLPVVILTSSGQDRDREEGANLGASDYKMKPAGFTELLQLAKDVAQRWLPGPTR